MSETSISNWSHLQSDLLIKIVENLTVLSDRFRFRAVCSHWRHSLPKIPTPWLLLPENECQVSTFLCFQGNKKYQLPIPDDFHDPTLICTSPYGWLFLLNYLPHDQTPSLFNPITGSRIVLPSLPFPCNYIHGDSHITLQARKSIRMCKLIMNCNEPNILFVILALRNNMILRLQKKRGGNDILSWKPVYSCGGLGRGVSDFTFYGGCYFVLEDKEHKCIVIDAENNKVVSVIPWVSSKHDTPCLFFWGVPSRFLVESSSGEELYLVISHLDDKWELFEVFRFDRTTKSKKWSTIRDIGNDVIFVDAYRGMALPESDLDGLKGNCIVFLGKPTASLKTDDRCLSVYDIGNDSVEKFPCYFEDYLMVWRKNGWFVPKF